MARPKKQVEVESVTPDHEYDSSVLRFCRGVQEVLGDGVHVHLAAIKMRPSRLAELAVGRPRFTPLRWSEVDETQKKALEALVVYRGPEDFVMYGDTCVVTCAEADWQAEMKRKAKDARQRQDQELSVQRLERETGVPIDTRWEDIDPALVPR